MIKRVFFADFDGTVTLADSCYIMVQTFAKGDWQRLNDLWEQKILDTEEVARRTFALFDADRKELDELLGTIQIDPGFPAFARTVRQKGDCLYILSDGYDYCIESILRREGIADIPFFSNCLEINGRSFGMKSGRRNPDCGTCGTCKRSLMLELKGEAAQTVYIGDGASDQCAGAAADILFAKDSLARYCRQKGIAFHPYATFFDILAWYEQAE
ncbi:MAG: MtnX-like HAD-IB family phosphatase [bacterium]